MLAGLVLFSGCASFSDTADIYRHQIQQQTAQIANAATSAQAHISSADAHVAAAATQPTNPPKTNELLQGARLEMSAAQVSLATIAPAAAVIDDRSAAAAKLTAVVENKLDAERNHWIGYKGRVTFGILGALSVISFIAILIIRTNGAGPILATLAQICAAIYTRIFKPVGIYLFHSFTLFAFPLADRVNANWDKQQGNADVLVHDLAKKS